MPRPCWDLTNPDLTNPDLTNPDLTNPDLTNPDIAAGSLTDVHLEPVQPSALAMFKKELVLARQPL